MNLPARGRGFTLIEMVMVAAVVGVLVAMAVPMMRDFIVRNRVKTVGSDLHASLTLARSEAIKRNAGVDVVPVSTANWAQGWVVRFGTTVLQVQDAYVSITLAGPAGTVSYSGNGRQSGTTSVSFTVSATGNAAIQARCVYIEPSGRPSMRIDKDGDSSNGCN